LKNLQELVGAEPRRVRARALAAAAIATLIAGCAPQPRAPWQAVAVPTDANFTGAWFSDPLNGWLAGSGWSIDGGILGRTRDGGRTWSFETGIVPGTERGKGLGRVQFRDTLAGWATAAEGQVMLTADGGETWRPVRLPSGGGYLNDLEFLDAREGWAAGTQVAHTEDGGETWHTLFRSESENGYVTANAIHFIDDSRGWLVGQVGTLMRTDDGGGDWTPVKLPLDKGEHPTLWDVTFVDGAQGWVAGEHGCIFHTRDGGTTWERQDHGVPIVRPLAKGETPRRDVLPGLETEPDRLTVSAIRFADAAHGWAVGYYADVAESVVLRTDDGGGTWSTEHVQPGEELRALFVLDREHAWAAGDRARTQSQVVLRRAPHDR
jgi:photosystem II stability/assembly factor-like uncharacterized protein